MAEIELSSYLEALRSELQKSIEKGERSDLRFGLEKIDLEIEIGIESGLDAKGDAKLRFLVFDATLTPSGKVSSKHTQKVKMSLVPVYKNKVGSTMVASEVSARPAS